MDAQREFARKIAILELVPYHSVEYRGAVHRTLPSSQRALRALEDLRNGRLVIVPRKHRDWGLEKPNGSEVHVRDNLVTYYSRAAWVPAEVRRLIIDRLLN